MDLYLFTLGLSITVLFLMAVLGLSHHHAPGKTTAAHGHGRLHPHDLKAHRDTRPGAGATLLAMFSPRTFCSLLLGFGATGLLLRPFVPVTPLGLFALAVLGGWVFEKWVMTPLWAFLFRFASAPARTLDTMAHEMGCAATDFDAAGQGLISVQLDGQVRQVLGTLAPEERSPNVPRVRTGDPLVIRAVDSRRNTCTVSRRGC